MQSAVPMIILFIPVLALATVAIVAIAQGLRLTDEPGCRGCGALFKQFGPTLEACPECGCTITRPRDVRFRGRRRPRWLWALSGALCLPALLIAAIILAVSMGWLTERSFAKLKSPGPIRGTMMTSIQAQALSDDTLIATLARAPDGSEGWRELFDRLEQQPASDEKMISVVDTIDTVAQGVKANKSNPPLARPVSPEMAFTLDRAITQLGYGHPRIQSFLAAHLLPRKTCPAITYNSKLTLSHTTKGAFDPSNDGLSWILSAHALSLKVRPVITAIRIDGVDCPSSAPDGEQHWNGARYHLMIEPSNLTEGATQPGEHTVEIDLMNAVVPRYMIDQVPVAQWPKNLITASTTLECAYTVPANE